jgi:hypothetical protein
VSTDLPAVTWLAVTAALAAHAVAAANPRLLPFVVLAAWARGRDEDHGDRARRDRGASRLWAGRRSLRSVAPALGLALVAAAGTAAVWPIRNLVDHGSPLWPFQAWPGGDPIPPAFAEIDDAFLDHPRALLDGRVADYLQVLGGGLVLLLGALVLPLLARSRLALGAGAVVALASLAWMTAPYTGILTDTELAVGAVRYLLPALAAAAAAIALSARGLARPVVLAVLVVAFGWSLLRSLDVGFPLTPNLATVVLPAALGAAVALVAPATVLRPLALVLPLAALVGLAVAAPGLVDRHAERVRLEDAAVLRALGRDPAFDDRNGRTVATAPGSIALAAGPAVQHALRQIPPGEPCARTRRRLDEGWLILQIRPLTRSAVRLPRACRAAASCTPTRCSCCTAAERSAQSGSSGTDGPSSSRPEQHRAGDRRRPEARLDVVERGVERVLALGVERQRQLVGAVVEVRQRHPEEREALLGDERQRGGEQVAGGGETADVCPVASVSVCERVARV